MRLNGDLLLMTVQPFAAREGMVASAASTETSVLLAKLSATDAAVRRVALIELADLEDPDLVEPVRNALRHDADAAVRAEAARILAAWEDETTVDALCGALLDTSDEVRETAAQSLAALKQAASATTLCRWAACSEPHVLAAVLRGLRELRAAQSFMPALDALGHANANVRLEAVGVLGWLRDARALAPLARLVTHDDHADLRRAAAGALGFAAADDFLAIHALLVALRDEAWQVREEAATTLGKLRPAIAREPLIAALDDPFWQVGVRAARALGRLGDIDAAPNVASLLTHAVSNLRKEAALALGELCDPRTVPALQAARDDRDPDVRKAVRIALNQLESAAR